VSRGGASDSGRRHRWLGLSALALLFLFRLGYGLSSDFWTEDERNIYLLGLKFFTTGRWPYFGPDVVWTQSQIPGALMGLLVGLPFYVLAIPEAPFVLLNLLSFSSLLLLAWYVRRRLPPLPAWFVYGWLLTAPWTLGFSTHVVNPSYVLPASIVFFIGFFETLPALRAGLLPPWLGGAMMGFALLWIAQIHMSWVLLPPFLLLASGLAAREKRGQLPGALLGLAIGASVSGSLLLPTLVVHGLAGSGGVERTVQLHPLGLGTLAEILTRFLSFASFEVSRFLGLSTARRLVFLFQHPWMVPVVLYVGIAGVIQVVLLAAFWFKRSSARKEWPAVKMLALATPLWIYLAFFFSVQSPWPHAYYVALPVAMIYGFYCYAFVADRPAWRRGGALLLALGLLFHLGLAVGKGPWRSLYRDRGLVSLALDSHEFRLLGERRFVEPRDGQAPSGGKHYHAAEPVSDLEIVEATWSKGVFGRVSLFRLVIRNRGQAAAYGDIRYRSVYYDSSGGPLRDGQGTLKEILQPGETRSWETVVDGMIQPSVVRARIEIDGAVKYWPAVRQARSPSDGSAN
jgi:hypothetical protein